MNKSFKSRTIKDWMIELILYAIAIVLIPVGVVITINSHTGAGGYDAFTFAVASKLHMQPSIGIYIVSAVLLVLAAFIRKSYPRIETFVTAFFLGISTDLAKLVLAPLQADNLWSGIALVTVGVLIIAVGVACYVISIFPTNPVDDFVVALSERGIRFGLAKVSTDLVLIVLALVLGGEIGVGTIICMFLLGPVADKIQQVIRKMLGRTENKAITKEVEKDDKENKASDDSRHQSA